MAQHGDSEDVDGSRNMFGTVREKVKSVWRSNKGIFLILLAQMTGSTMDAMARLLQTEGRGMHPFQVGFF